MGVFNPLGVQAVGLLGGLGDDSEFLGIGQHNFFGRRLQELHEPQVAGRGLNNHFEGLEQPEELDDLVRLIAVWGLPCHDGQFLIPDADGDNLLVEVEADEVHCRTPSLGEREIRTTTQVFPRLKGSAKRRVDLPLIASISRPSVLAFRIPDTDFLSRQACLHSRRKNGTLEPRSRYFLI